MRLCTLQPMARHGAARLPVGHDMCIRAGGTAILTCEAMPCHGTDRGRTASHRTDCKFVSFPCTKRKEIRQEKPRARNLNLNLKMYKEKE